MTNLNETGREVIQLPANLRILSDDELTALNAKLQTGEAQLDWTVVEVAPADVLDRLLSGLEIDVDADVLGVTTVPDSLSLAIDEAVSRLQPGPRRARRSRTPDKVKPQIFETPAADDAEDIVEPDAGVDQDGPDDRVPELIARTSEDLRDEFVRLIHADLLGPVGGDEEEVFTAVTERYILGKLAPQHTVVSPKPEPPDEDEIVDALYIEPELIAPDVKEEEGEEARDEPPATGPRVNYPSTIGFSFTVSDDTEAVDVTATWGKYERGESEMLFTAEGSPRRVWRRSPRGGTVRLPIVDGEITPPLVPDPAEPEVTIQGRIRTRPEHNGDRAVTLFLHNGQTAPKTNKASAWLFQAGLAVRGLDGEPVFVRRPLPSQARDDEEARALEMRYRNDREFAVGHGTSVDWDVWPADSSLATAVRTTTIPAFELPRTDAPRAEDVPGLESVELGMAELGALDGPAAAAALMPLAEAYGRWIEGLNTQRKADPSLASHQKAAHEAIEKCRAALIRITEGVEVIRDDAKAAEAFAFMNRAMAQQRVHSIYALAKRDNPGASLADFDVTANRSWRPFQLAFILLSLPALARLDHPNRAADPDGPLAQADLLWFPTGGGKTEAYLGLAAFAMSIRRLQDDVPGFDGSAGLSVLMRYTLRLLTLQQFQRATALICAMELMRREARQEGDLRWGDEPFRIGLWVGYRMTPNTNSQSAEAIKKLKAGDPLGVGNPAQLTHCPWCGTAIDPRRDIDVETYESGHCVTLIYCGDKLGACPFTRKQAAGRGLPVVVVDEEIYRRPPSLMIATVDKFAQMPWKGATAALFGRVDGHCDRHGFKSLDPELAEATFHPKKGSLPTAKLTAAGPLRPPDLIIQDELHLISGPIGSMVGLYETAIDALSTFEVDGFAVRPKVIASTATIRQAPEQIHALFMRRAEVFPPQGLDANDSFFAKQVPLEGSDAAPGRLYLGVLARGERLKAVLIRVYVAALAAAQTLYKRYGRAADPYMTLVGYFGSMRELGGTRRLVDDDIKARLLAIDERGLERRPNLNVKELTSRVSSGEIPKVLSELNAAFDPEKEKEWRKKGAVKPIDVLLATNMVSVGVDVPRLGLMVVDGQPKTTAEYIQATSRVGRERDKPGVVITVYNWARPRDLSHFERFRHYHATFYQQVEALSITPFSPGAIDRGLSGLFAALVRLGSNEFVPNAGASAFRRDHPAVKDALALIKRRAERIESPRTGDDLERQLAARVDDWAALVAGSTGSRLGYQGDQEEVPLLHMPDGGPWERFTCLNSLRDVEASVDLVLVDGWMDEDDA